MALSLPAYVHTFKTTDGALTIGVSQGVHNVATNYGLTDVDLRGLFETIPRPHLPSAGSFKYFPIRPIPIGVTGGDFQIASVHHVISTIDESQIVRLKSRPDGGPSPAQDDNLDATSDEVGERTDGLREGAAGSHIFDFEPNDVESGSDSKIGSRS